MRQDSVRESVYYIYYARDIIWNKQIVFQRDFAIYPNIDFEYILILGTKLYFHSDETLKLLPERQQNIFKELKENQKIVIDGKEYKWIWWE